MSNFIPMVSSSPPPMDDGGGFDWDDDDDFGTFTSANDSSTDPVGGGDHTFKEADSALGAKQTPSIQKDDDDDDFADFSSFPVTECGNTSTLNNGISDHGDTHTGDQRPEAITLQNDVDNIAKCVTNENNSDPHSLSNGTLIDSGVFSSNVSPTQPTDVNDTEDRLSMDDVTCSSEPTNHICPDKIKCPEHTVSNEPSEMNTPEPSQTSFHSAEKSPSSQESDFENDGINKTCNVSDIKCDSYEKEDIPKVSIPTNSHMNSSQQQVNITGDCVKGTPGKNDESQSAVSVESVTCHDSENGTEDRSKHSVTQSSAVNTSQCDSPEETTIDNKPYPCAHNEQIDKNSENGTNETMDNQTTDSMGRVPADHENVTNDHTDQDSEFINEPSECVKDVSCGSDSDSQNELCASADKSCAINEPCHDTNSENVTETDTISEPKADKCEDFIEAPRTQECKTVDETKSGLNEQSGDFGGIATDSESVVIDKTIPEPNDDVCDKNDEFGDFGNEPTSSEYSTVDGKTKTEANDSDDDDFGDFGECPTTAVADNVKTSAADDQEVTTGNTSNILKSESETSVSKAVENDDGDFDEFRDSNVQDDDVDDDFGDFGDFNTSSYTAGAESVNESTTFAAFPESCESKSADSNTDGGDWAAFSSPGTDVSKDKVEAVEGGDDWAAFSEPQTTEAITEAAGDEDDDWGEFDDEESIASVKPQEPVSRPDAPKLPQDVLHNMSKQEKLAYAVTTCFPCAVDSSGQESEDSRHVDTDIFTDNPCSVWDKMKVGSEALTYQYTKSKWNDTLFNTLHVDTRNILIGHKKAPVPVYAAGMAILEPIKGQATPLKPAVLVDTTKSDLPSQPSQDSIPVAQFDWSSSGLTNPLEANNKTLNLDFLIQGQASKSSEWESEFLKDDCIATPKSTIQPLENILASMKTTPTFKPTNQNQDMSKEAAKIVQSLPDLTFMKSKVLMFPVRLDGS